MIAPRGTKTRAMRATRKWITLACAVIATASTWACAGLLDIEALPLAAKDSGAIDGTVDAGDGGCQPRGNTFCQSLCPPADFCDDFENGRASEDWKGFLGFASPIISGAPGTNIKVAFDNFGTNPSQAAVSNAISTNDDSATAVLATEFPQLRGRKLRGVQVRVSVRVAQLKWDFDGGTTRKTLSFVAMGASNLNEGIGVLFVDDDPAGDSLRIVLQQRGLGGNTDVPTVDLTEVTNQPKISIFNNRIFVDAIIGTADLLREMKRPCTISVDAGEDAGGPETMRFHIKFGDVFARCASFQGALTDPSWLSFLAIAAGAAVSDFGTADVRLDDIALNFID